MFSGGTVGTDYSMNNQLTNEAIVLARVDYGEADRIITMLTPQAGKLRLMAKGVRRVRSKLAGGVELFSTTHITYTKGRGDIGTLVSSRLITHYGQIVKDIDRTMLGYELIKQLNKATEDEPEADYFHLLQASFAALNEAVIPLDLVRLWFGAQLLRLSGHTPNLQTEMDGTKLQADKSYEFSFDDMAFVLRAEGTFGVDDIKFLRIVFSDNNPAVIVRVNKVGQLATSLLPLITNLRQLYVR